MARHRKRQSDTESDAFLAPEEPEKNKFISRNNLLLLFYVVMAILVGTANRVTFKLMQYSMMNYSYFLSQITTFIYLPVNFIIVLAKLLFTDHITKEMLAFPQWKFIVMGLFDSLQGLLIVVGGAKVPGIMQSLLLQGAVPVTMLFSIFMLRNRGDDIARTARHVLQKKGIAFTEEYAGDQVIEKAQGQSVCRILVNDRDIGNVPELLKHEKAPDEDLFVTCFSWLLGQSGWWKKTRKHGDYSIQNSDLSSVTLFSGIRREELEGKVVLISDAHPWSVHFRRFYTLAQYVGALIIMVGLVISVGPALFGGNSAGNSDPTDIGSYLVFFSATIPIALSGVYKEIAFKSVEDMDVWYLNGYVALPQFLIGLIYAPLAAVMSGMEVNQIPSNLWNGLQCWLVGTNFITREQGYDCSIESDCGDPSNPCCDSCDGSIPSVSSIRALWAVIGYMVVNIAYNVFLVLVIKHGSAALMYATSTLVLPLGALAFTISVFMGAHTQSFNAYTGAGLGVILVGLLIYRFVDMILRKRKTE